MSQTAMISCKGCGEEIGEMVNEKSPLEINCLKCINTPGIFQEMGADPENKSNLFSRGFDTNENY